MLGIKRSEESRANGIACDTSGAKKNVGKINDEKGWERCMIQNLKL
jgi:hypothetical protein